MCSESPSSTGRQRRRIGRRIASFSAIAIAFLVLLMIEIYTDHGLMELVTIDPVTSHRLHANVITTSHRKLLNKHGETEKTVVVEEPNRIWSDRCSKSDILISQGATAPLPNGIPTYTVEIMNVCVSGCEISSIHINCGWFSSARIINPHVFKRLRFNDCLVNDGNPLANGRTLSFKYANTFRYPLSVASVKCY